MDICLTKRKKILELLKKQKMTARDLSQSLRIPEKEVYEHLVHVKRSLGPRAKLIVAPSRCRQCGFEFSKRERFTPPGKCPRCRSEYVSSPVFGILSEEAAIKNGTITEDFSEI